MKKLATYDIINLNHRIIVAVMGEGTGVEHKRKQIRFY